MFAIVMHEQLASSGQLADPVAILLGRERLDAICARLSSLTAKERGAVAVASLRAARGQAALGRKERRTEPWVDGSSTRAVHGGAWRS